MTKYCPITGQLLGMWCGAGETVCDQQMEKRPAGLGQGSGGFAECVSEVDRVLGWSAGALWGTGLKPR